MLACFYHKRSIWKASTLGIETDTLQILHVVFSSSAHFYLLAVSFIFLLLILSLRILTQLFKQGILCGLGLQLLRGDPVFGFFSCLQIGILATVDTLMLMEILHRAPD